MRKPGRRPKPTALRVIEGNAGGRPFNIDEPIPPALEDKPEAPKWLNRLGRREWDRVAQQLWEMGVLTAIDQSALAMFAEAWSRYEQAVIDLNRAARKDPKTHGAVVFTDKGNAIMNPLFGQVNALRRDALKIAAEFGLTPSARTGMSGKSKAEHDPVARKYFGG